MNRKRSAHEEVKVLYEAMQSGALRARADRIYRVTDYLYRTGRHDWGHRWGREWHRIASVLKGRNIRIFVS